MSHHASDDADANSPLLPVTDSPSNERQPSLHIGMSPESDGHDSFWLFSFDRALSVLCSFSLALSVFVSGVVYLSDLSCFIPPDSSSQYLSYPTRFINTSCGIMLLHVNTQAYGLWIQSLLLIAPLSFFYLVYGRNIQEILTRVQAAYTRTNECIRDLSGDDLRKRFAFAFLRSEWPWRETLISNPHKFDLIQAPDTASPSQPLLPVLPVDEDHVTLPYSLKKELDYSTLSTSLRLSPGADKEAFTYMLDYVCYPQSYEWMKGKSQWTRWYQAAVIVSVLIGIGCVIVWPTVLSLQTLTLDHSHFWCQNIPISLDPGSNAPVFLRMVNETNSAVLSCDYGPQQTLLTAWWINVVLVSLVVLLLLYRVCCADGFRGMRSDRDFLYLSMKDTRQQCMLPNHSQARGYLRNMVRLAGCDVPSSNDGIQWGIALKEAWRDQHIRYYAKLFRAFRQPSTITDMSSRAAHLDQYAESGHSRSRHAGPSSHIYPPV